MISHAVSSFGFTAITNTWHQILTLKASSDSVVNTLGFSPVGCQLLVAIRLMTNEFLRSFFYNLLAI